MADFDDVGDGWLSVVLAGVVMEVHLGRGPATRETNSGPAGQGLTRGDMNEGGEDGGGGKWGGENLSPLSAPRSPLLSQVKDKHNVDNTPCPQRAKDLREGTCMKETESLGAAVGGGAWVLLGFGV